MTHIALIRIKVLPFFLFLIVQFLTACEKDKPRQNSGKYSVAFRYNGNEQLELHMLLDGESIGTFKPTPNVNPSYVTDCKMLNRSDDLVNVLVFKDIAPGKHVLQIKTSTGELVKTMAFEMIDEECIIQEASIPLQ